MVPQLFNKPPFEDVSWKYETPLKTKNNKETTTGLKMDKNIMDLALFF